MRSFCAVCLLAVAIPGLAQCLSDAATNAASIVGKKQEELLKIKVEEMATELSPVLQDRIHAFKDALANAADISVRCNATSDDAVAMQKSLATLLRANQPEKSFTPKTASSTLAEDHIYGANLRVGVSTPTDLTQLRAVQMSYGIECGDDSMLLLYRKNSQGWERILRWQSPDFKEISGAFGDFFVFTILPDIGSGATRAVVAHGTPWCTSRFSGFKIDLLATGSAGTQPPIIWHKQDGYSRGDAVTRLRSTSDGFELRLNAPAKDMNEYERTVIYRYRVAGDKVTRIEPIATNGRGFVEEWMDMPWDEAKEQTAPEAIPGMKAVHEQLSRSDKDPNTYVSYSYGPVRACLQKGRYEVEMDANPGGPQFYAIQQTQNGYMLVNFGTTQDERCSGPDLMKKK